MTEPINESHGVMERWSDAFPQRRTSSLQDCITPRLICVLAALALLFLTSGGWLHAADATGFFRVEQRAGKWLMIDPDGKPFHLRGCNHYGVGTGPTNLREKYGDVAKWRESMRDRHREWIRLMRRLYGSIERWRETYGIPVKDWPEIAALEKPLDGYNNRTRLRQDKEAFLQRICEQWHRLHHDTIRKYDPNHLERLRCFGLPSSHALLP